MRARFFLTGAALCVATLAALPVASADGETSLRLQFKAGEKRRYALHHLMEMQTPMPIPGLDKPVRMRGELGLEVLAVLPDGSAKLRIVKGPTVAEPPNPLFAAHTMALTADATSTTRGEIKVVRSPSLTEAAAQALEQILRSFGGVLPEKAVAPGASWTVPIDQQLPQGALGPMGGPATMRGEATMTFRGIEQKDGRRCAMIPATATLKLDASAGASDGTGGGGMHVDASGKGSGESCFDLDRGDFVESAMAFEMSINFAGPNVPMPIQMKASSKIELRRIEDGVVELAPKPAAHPKEGVLRILKSCPPDNPDCVKQLLNKLGVDPARLGDIDKALRARMKGAPSPTPTPDSAPAPTPAPQSN